MANSGNANVFTGRAGRQVVESTAAATARMILSGVYEGVTTGTPIALLIPKKRSGSSYFPSFLEPRRRSEQAIVAVVLEAYVNGVSTRKVDRLVEQLGIDGMTKDRVSALCRALDEQVELFRHGRLRAPTRTCGSMLSRSRSETMVAWSPRRLSSPTRCTSPASER